MIYSDRQTQIFRHTCVFLNKGPVLGVIIVFIIGNADEIYPGVDERTKLVSLISGHNVIFLIIEYGFYFTIH